MELIVMLPDDDVHLLDELAAEQGSSRSAVLQEAVALLRNHHLGTDYASAWAEWSAGDGRVWDSPAPHGQ
jgi:predicted transcriptional regulator